MLFIFSLLQPHTHTDTHTIGRQTVPDHCWGKDTVCHDWKRIAELKRSVGGPSESVSLCGRWFGTGHSHGFIQALRPAVMEWGLLKVGVYLGEGDGKRRGALRPKPAPQRRNSRRFVSFVFFEKVSASRESNRMSVPGYLCLRPLAKTIIFILSCLLSHFIFLIPGFSDICG